MDRMNRQRALVVWLLVGLSAALPAQELVISTGRSSTPPIVPAPTFVFPDVAGGLPYPPILILAPEPDGGFPPWENPHGLALFGTDRAVTTRITTGEIHVIDTANAVTVSEFVLPGFNGIGTLAIDPAQTKLFASLWTKTPAPSRERRLIRAPTGSSSERHTRRVAFSI